MAGRKVTGRCLVYEQRGILVMGSAMTVGYQGLVPDTSTLMLYGE
ncbi:MAG: hypothetical protein U0Q18_32170 [Bryobacteraceae bacterium]